MAKELKVVLKVNKELHKLRQSAEGCMANTKLKLWMQERRSKGNNLTLTSNMF